MQITNSLNKFHYEYVAIPLFIHTSSIYVLLRWSWNANTLATSGEELTHWKRPWCWEGLEAGGEGDDRGWDGWMASRTRWAWVWVNSRSWWWTGRPGMLWFMGSQRIGHDWATELNWTVWWCLHFPCGTPTVANQVLFLDFFPCILLSLPTLHPWSWVWHGQDRSPTWRWYYLKGYKCQ